jgi:hypothetical protein
MQRKLNECVSSMLRSAHRSNLLWLLGAGGMLILLMLVCAAVTSAQVNTATLAGTVLDAQGLGVKGAKIIVTNTSTGAERTAVSEDTGAYILVGLPPGHYKMSVDGGANFAAYENPSLELTVGERATIDARLELKGLQQSVTVSTETSNVETTKSDVSQTIGQRRIENLPINGRNYINFTLTNSQTTRDVSPTIGPAPNSGLNIGGARARGTMVSVDGADAVDNSINGIRSTLSQEGVQEFQMILSNYNAEYGRASGGVINIVTKSGTNQFHGDAFGFLRNSAFQARNPFSGQVDPVTGNLDPVKQAYTRVQTGLTFGVPIRKDKTFFFFAYEYTQREESGFSSIGINNFGIAPLNCGTGCPLNGLPLTSDQATAVNTLLAEAAGAGNPVEAAQLQALAQSYAAFMGSASNVALNKVDFGLVAPALTSGLVKPGPGPQFPVPVTCPVGAVVGTVTCSSIPAAPGAQFSYGVATLPGSYVGLNALRGNFPVMEKTSLWSGRLDHIWNSRNNSFLRVGVSPSLVTGIESTAQNQVFGENAGSRTGLNQTRDLSFTFQHDTVINDKTFNEFRMQIARRGLHFGYSDLPGGSDIGVNIPGYAYFGREPYSPVDRIERRFEFTDQISIVHGKHTFKTGADANVIQLRSKQQQIFQLDFGGVVNFGGISATAFSSQYVNPVTGAALPGATALQAYGLGIPQTYIQGIGTSNNPFDNLPFAFFFQDSWHVTRKLTVNYGVRYDVEVSPLFAPATAVNAAAEKALGVVEGIPRDYNNVAPRFGLAWDPKGNGKTVIRAGYGIFYDHPLLAVAFDSATADGGRSVQLISSGGTASACGLVTALCGSQLDTPTNLNGSSIFQGALNALPSMFYEPQQQRFNPFAPTSIFANQNYLGQTPATTFPLPILPFTLPVTSNFVYGYAQQANLTIEHEIAGSWKISAGYQWTRGLHLNRPIDINSTDPVLLTNNLAKADAAGFNFANPLQVALPTTGYGPMVGSCPVGSVGLNTSGGGSIILVQPQLPFAAQGFTGPNCTGAPVGVIGTAAAFNFFRPSGPNPSFVGLAAYPLLAQLASAVGFPGGHGVPVPFNSVDAQTSTGNSYYNALTINVTKRFSKGFEMLSSYTWSHSMDDSSDLQSPLEPQDSRFPNLEMSNSVNDQRHRWVTSGVYQSPAGKSGDGFFKHFFGNFTLAPIIELSSGRPFNVITGTDLRLDLGASQERPSLAASGATGTTSPFVPGVVFSTANVCLTNAGIPFTVAGGITPPLGCDGNLGRNRFTMPAFFDWDMRVAKRVPLGERLQLDIIADAFNLTNHTNIAAVNQLCDPTSGATCNAGQHTAAYDARQFQFALKISW